MENENGIVVDGNPILVEKYVITILTAYASFLMLRGNGQASSHTG